MKQALVVLMIALLVGCSQVPTELDPELHGQIPADVPNMPTIQGDLPVRHADVTYFEDVTGYLARPDDTTTYPGVVMIHEWWGLNQNIRDMADELASQGYVVLAVDLYEGKLATVPAEAQALVGSFNRARGLANMQAAVSYLREQGSPTIGSLGWCFGGGQSLQVGLAEDLDATVIYYGHLETDEATLTSLKQPVLGIFGAEDTSIPVDQVELFGESLTNLGVHHEIHVYDGAGHAFANPSGDRYVQEAADDAWEKTTAFLDASLR